MNTKHTPGPWNLTPIENRIVSGNTVIARIYAHTDKGQPSNVAPFTEEDAANAKLIAAAPELLEALQELCADKYLADPINADRMGKAKAAIAKATE